jgi:hypothetical protein
MNTTEEALNVAEIELPLKPWQRLAAGLFATGMPIHEIAPQVTQPVPVVSEFITSRRGQVIIGEVLDENKARLDDLLDACAVDSILTLIRIRDTSRNETARISACNALLSKTLPGVKARDVKSKDTTRHGRDPEEEIARLKMKVASI